MDTLPRTVFDALRRSTLAASLAVLVVGSAAAGIIGVRITTPGPLVIPCGGSASIAVEITYRATAWSHLPQTFDVQLWDDDTFFDDHLASGRITFGVGDIGDGMIGRKTISLTLWCDESQGDCQLRGNAGWDDESGDHEVYAWIPQTGDHSTSLIVRCVEEGGSIAFHAPRTPPGGVARVAATFDQRLPVASGVVTATYDVTRASAVDARFASTVTSAFRTTQVDLTTPGEVRFAFSHPSALFVMDFRMELDLHVANGAPSGTMTLETTVATFFDASGAPVPVTGARDFLTIAPADPDPPRFDVTRIAIEPQSARVVGSAGAVQDLHLALTPPTVRVWVGTERPESHAIDLLGSALVNGDGSFEVSGVALDPGASAVALFAEDGAGRRSSVRMELHALRPERSFPADLPNTVGVRAHAAASADDALYVAWIDDRSGAGGDVFLRIQTNGGRETRTEEVLVSRDPIGPGVSVKEAPRLAVATDGSRVYVAWRERAPSSPIAQPVLNASMDGGRSFRTVATTVRPPATSSAAELCLAVDPTDGDRVHVLWTATSAAGTTRAWIATSRDAGRTFASPIALDAGGRTAADASLAVNARGDAFALWTEERAGVDGLWFARSEDGGTTFSSPIAVNHPPLTSLHRAARRSALALDPANPDAVHVVWEDLRDTATGNTRSLYANASVDGGRTFAPFDERVVDGSSAGDTSQPRITVANGRVHVLWLTARQGGREVWLRSRSASGPFGAAQRLDSNVPRAGDADEPRLVASGDLVVAAWTDDRHATATSPSRSAHVALSTDGGRSFRERLASHADPPSSARAADPILVLDAAYDQWTLVHRDDRGGRSRVWTTGMRAPRLVPTRPPVPGQPFGHLLRDAGPSREGQLLLVLVGASGTSPGFPLMRGRHVDLNVDPLTLVGLSLGSLLTSFVTNGEAATPEFPFPPLDPFVPFHAVGLTVDFPTGTVTGITDPISLAVR